MNFIDFPLMDGNYIYLVPSQIAGFMPSPNDTCFIFANGMKFEIKMSYNLLRDKFHEFSKKN